MFPMQADLGFELWCEPGHCGDLHSVGPHIGIKVISPNLGFRHDPTSPALLWGEIPFVALAAVGKWGTNSEVPGRSREHFCPPSTPSPPGSTGPQVMQSQDQDQVTRLTFKYWLEGWKGKPHSTCYSVCLWFAPFELLFHVFWSHFKCITKLSGESHILLCRVGGDVPKTLNLPSSQLSK